MANGLRMLLTAVTLLAVGCTPRPNSASPRGSEASTAARPAPRERRASQPGHATLQCERVEAGRSVAGRLIEAEVYGTGGSTVLILATIHGNEAVGTPLLRKLSAFLSEHPEVAANRRIVLVPVANPDGMAANRRTNANGVDLNRNFPASNHSPSQRHGSQPLSEPESRALHVIIERYAPARIISIHQPLGCIDYDGPGDRLARAMATTSGLPLKRLGSLAGSLGSYAGLSKAIPIITVEFSRSADALAPDELWNRYGRMLLVSICYPDSAPVLAGLDQRSPGTSHNVSTPVLGN